MDFDTPIDMPRGAHFGSNYITVYSMKLKRTCKFYSDLEYFNFLSLEINPEVKRFCEQPFKAPVNLDNQLKHVTFDMWVLYRDEREELQEVKYTHDITGDTPEALRSQEQIRREELWCKENNIDFVVRTEKTIPQGIFFLRNANIMAARLRRYVPTQDDFYNPRITNALKQFGKLTIHELIINNMLPLNCEIDHLCYMYEKGMIKMNINVQPLGNKTEVSLWPK